MRSFFILLLLLIPFSSAYADDEMTFSLPEWIQNIFIYYGEGKINDQELVNSIQFLLENKIISVNNQKDEIQKYQERISHLEAKIDELTNQMIDQNYKDTLYITYSIEDIPMYADKTIVEQAANDAFEKWDRMNEQLDYVQVGSGGDIVLKFEKRLLLGGTALGYVESDNCDYDDCEIFLALGDQDCLGRWSQFTKESLQDTIMHEIGHTLGLEHANFFPHLLYSNTPPSYSKAQYDDLGYNIPKLLQEMAIPISKQKVFHEIETSKDKINDALQEFGITFEEYFSGEKIPDSKGFQAHFDNKINPLIEYHNSLIEQYDCHNEYSSVD